MNRIKAVIFDLNGVFLLSKNLSERLSEKSGKAVDEILAVMKPILKEVRNLERRGEEVWQPLLDLVGMDLIDFLNFYFSGESIDVEMLEFARSLKKKGVSIFILSNNFRERTEYYRKNFPMLFEVANKTYFSWETGLVKPDVRSYSRLLEENNLEGKDCIYIDNSIENLEVAESLGIKGVKYESGEQVMEEIDEMVG
ncbi:MAG: Hydrolase [Microgenomates group bacterium GW2011_GWC1_44_37]|uniref:Hydrolase n=1 Tax=Candidatus Collierbacteria bacterium GW2011_GWB2_44_22 TaxID=1618387 RepID=A0A0G1HXE2_9BACT|nr:MAG: Hydrolase [Candidatus Collierbacteria bacterium GW2011_GWA2_44_13]KKT51288.1 MAG: Hydrolase [Candidatus Collierbacteria bacterium GW2011_GWB2_44_22]KKT61664.1 MAG: Hydrolase [Candidatus Collierbacteria bacterium GW2011_GWD1_44_27]KKT68922.1 MAG: Hydrolase [Microgenomates group bacterium GW2011_GWC1_44_37]KKT87751.1 MAG: Hydrolase [Candidatus Collierbacteria bacterium GW2011_GWD2_45_10]